LPAEGAQGEAREPPEGKKHEAGEHPITAWGDPDDLRETTKKKGKGKKDKKHPEPDGEGREREGDFSLCGSAARKKNHQRPKKNHEGRASVLKEQEKAQMMTEVVPRMQRNGDWLRRKKILMGR